MGNSPSPQGLRRLSSCTNSVADVNSASTRHSRAGSNKPSDLATPSPFNETRRRHKFRLLKSGAVSDPRSPTDGVDRTPIGVTSQFNARQSTGLTKLMTNDGSFSPAQLPGPFTVPEELPSIDDYDEDNIVDAGAIDASTLLADSAEANPTTSAGTRSRVNQNESSTAAATSGVIDEESLECSARSDSELVVTHDTTRKTPLARIRDSFRSFLNGGGGECSTPRSTTTSSAPPKLMRNQWQRQACRRSRRRLAGSNGGESNCDDLQQVL